VLQRRQWGRGDRSPERDGCEPETVKWRRRWSKKETNPKRIAASRRTTGRSSGGYYKWLGLEMLGTFLSD
jgi:hypothetical protein